MNKYLKQFLWALCGLIFILSLTISSVSAHLAGQPPFFKINGKYSNLYPVPTTSLANFNLPQDLAGDNYLINQPINFEIDPTQLAVPLDVIAKTTFNWHFGDGAGGQGLKETHTFSKPGSYILTIYAQYDQISGNQLFQAVLLNVLPELSYKLPQATISINGKTSHDPLVDTLKFLYGQGLTFDASGSTAPSSKISSYFWDFGDSQSSKDSKISHTYSKDLPQQQVFPVLRIIDENGFIADSFVEVDNKQGNNTVSANVFGSKPNNNLGLLVLGGGLLVIGAVVVLALKKK